MIRLRVLGSTDLRGHDGQTLLSVLSQPKRLTLLVYLVLNATDGFTRRDKLLGLFWPESDTDKARGSLRRSLSYLRKSLGEGVLVTRGVEEVGVAAAAVECDAVQFEASLDEGSPRAAWDFYGGPLLDGVHVSASDVDSWIENERSRLQRRAVGAARALAEEAEGREDLDEAVVWARNALALEPLSETCVRQLIGLLGRAGDREGAVRTYDSFTQRLSEDLGLEPAADTRALIEALRAASYPTVPRSGVTASSAAINVPTHVAPAATEQLPERTATPPTRRFRALTVSTLTLAAVTLVAAFWGARRLPFPGRVVRSIVVMPDGQEMTDNAGRRFALSPDGSRFVYAGVPDGRLWVQRRDQLNATALPGTEGAISPFFSPEGDRVGFIANGEVRIVSLDGGPVVGVTTEVDRWGGVTWGPDGVLYAASPNFGGLMSLSAEPGAVPRAFTTLDSRLGETKHSWPDVLPDGKNVVFTITRARAGALGSEYFIAVADIEGGGHRVLFEGLFARHAGPDHLIYVTADSTLMVVPFDSESLAVTGPPSVVSGEQRVGFRHSVDVSVSRSGTLMYSTGSMDQVTELVWVTRAGDVESLEPPWRGDLLHASLSPDGSRVAVVVRSGETSDVWIGNMDTGGRQVLTTEGGVNGYPTWTPDGHSVTYFARAAGAAELWTKSADGRGAAVLQLRRPRDLAESLWSPDGEWLVYRTTNVPQPSLTEGGEPVRGAGDILAIRPGLHGEPIALAVTEGAELAPALSPDGRWLAYSSDDTGRRQVFVIPFPNPDGTRWPVTADGGIEPVWSQSTGELFYRDSRANMVAVEFETTPTFSLGRSTVLFNSRGFVSDGLHAMYSAAPDGSRFLMMRREPRSPGHLIVVENWLQELGPPGGRQPPP